MEGAKALRLYFEWVLVCQFGRYLIRLNSDILVNCTNQIIINLILHDFVFCDINAKIILLLNL